MEPWPRWARRLALALLGAVIGIGVIVALSDGGILPLAGSFAAAFVVPVIVLVRVRVLTSRRARLLRELGEAEASGPRASDLRRVQDLRAQLTTVDRRLARLRRRS